MVAVIISQLVAGPALPLLQAPLEICVPVCLLELVSGITLFCTVCGSLQQLLLLFLRWNTSHSGL